MPVMNYKVFDWGNPIGRGVMQSRRVAMAGVGKSASETSPSAVANELIVGELGRAARLPVPPGMLATDPSGKPYHVSMNFYLTGEDLPPADALALATEQPELSCGIVLFDMWVCNDDRHAGNLAFDKVSKKVTLFDHSHSLMREKRGIERLKQYESKLGIGGHCLLPHIRSFSGFPKWAGRMKAIPEYYIRESVSDNSAFGISTSDAEFCADYLVLRRTKLMDLLLANRPEFPKIADWPKPEAPCQEQPNT